MGVLGIVLCELRVYMSVCVCVCVCVCVPGMVVSLNLHHNIKCE